MSDECKHLLQKLAPGQQQKQANDQCHTLLSNCVELLKEISAESEQYSSATMAHVYDNLRLYSEIRVKVTQLEQRLESLKSSINSISIASTKSEKRHKIDFVTGKPTVSDVMLYEAIKRSDFDGSIQIRKLNDTHYMFGTKKIMAKVVADKLVIRVGSGFMSVNEFIEQYGRMEVIK